MARTRSFTHLVAICTYLKVGIRPELYYCNPRTNRYELRSYVTLNCILLMDPETLEQVLSTLQAEHPLPPTGTSDTPSSASTSSYIEVDENMPSPAVSEGPGNEMSIQETLNAFLETSTAGLASDGEDFIDLMSLSPDIEVFDQFCDTLADNEKPDLLEEKPTPINEN